MAKDQLSSGIVKNWDNKSVVVITKFTVGWNEKDVFVSFERQINISEEVRRLHERT